MWAEIHRQINIYKLKRSGDRLYKVRRAGTPPRLTAMAVISGKGGSILRKKNKTKRRKDLSKQIDGSTKFEIVKENDRHG